MYGCESWTIKKAECQRINAFELWYWRRPLRVPWTARRSNQSILKEISPEYSLEGLMLRLKPTNLATSCEELTRLKKPWCRNDWGQEKKGTTEDEVVGWHHRLNEHGFGWAPGVGNGQGGLACCSPWGRKELYMTEQLNWTELREVFVTFSGWMDGWMGEMGGGALCLHLLYKKNIRDYLASLFYKMYLYL